MRRALIGIVPDELLRRKRKALVSRGPLAGISAGWPNVMQFSSQMQTAAFGIVDSQRFVDALQRARRGQEVSVVFVMRAFGIELWVRSLTRSCVMPPLGTERETHGQMFIGSRVKSISW
jgi:asparagine synthase (glutamine-hydrolysing)